MTVQMAIRATLPELRAAAVPMATTAVRRCLIAMIRSGYVPMVPGAVQTAALPRWAMPGVPVRVQAPTAGLINARVVIHRRLVVPACHLLPIVQL